MKKSFKYIIIVMILLLSLTCVACDKKDKDGSVDTIPGLESGSDDTKVTAYDGVYVRVYEGEELTGEEIKVVGNVFTVYDVVVKIVYDGNKFSGSFSVDEEDVTLTGEFSSTGMTITIGEETLTYTKKSIKTPQIDTNFTIEDLKTALKKDLDSVNHITTLRNYRLDYGGDFGSGNRNSNGSVAYNYNEKIIEDDGYILNIDGKNVYYEQDYQNDYAFKNAIEENEYAQPRIDFYVFANHNNFGISTNSFISFRPIVDHLYNNLTTLLDNKTISFSDGKIELGETPLVLNLVVDNITIDVKLSAFSFTIDDYGVNKYYFDLEEEVLDATNNINVACTYKGVVEIDEYGTVDTSMPKELQVYLDWSDTNNMIIGLNKKLNMNDYDSETTSYQTEGTVTISDISNEVLITSDFLSKYQYEYYGYSFYSEIGESVVTCYNNYNREVLIIDDEVYDDPYDYNLKNNYNPRTMYTSMKSNFGIGTYLPGANFIKALEVVETLFLPLASENYFEAVDGVTTLKKAISSSELSDMFWNIGIYETFDINKFEIKMDGDNYVISMECKCSGNLDQPMGALNEYIISIDDMVISGFNTSAFEIDALS